MLRIIHIIFIFILFPVLINAQTINWATETGLSMSSAFVDGQVITNFGGSGLTARINVDLVSGNPRISSTDPTTAITGGNRTACRFTLTFLNGTASIRLNNFENLQRGERITLSNPDGQNIIVRQHSNNGSGLMTVDGSTVPALNTDVIEDNQAVVREVNNGGGTQWSATMNAITSFTWEYNAVGGVSATEGFILTLLSTTLPVELSYFGAKSTMDNTVTLDWQTDLEINNDYFSVERSTNGFDWEVIQTVDSRDGNSTETQAYSTEDNTPYEGISYYRLKQTDYDGSFTYSAIKAVTITKVVEVVIYPNPTVDIVMIAGVNYESNTIRVFNTAGQEVTSIINVERVGEQKLKLDMNPLANGIYLLKIADKVHQIQKY